MRRCSRISTRAYVSDQSRWGRQRLNRVQAPLMELCSSPRLARLGQELNPSLGSGDWDGACIAPAAVAVSGARARAASFAFFFSFFRFSSQTCLAEKNQPPRARSVWRGRVSASESPWSSTVCVIPLPPPLHRRLRWVDGTAREGQFAGGLRGSRRRHSRPAHRCVQRSPVHCRARPDHPCSRHDGTTNGP